jgi:hypothetical protein
MEHLIKNNPKRYKISDSEFSVSSVGDSPNRNRKGEIKPLTFLKGEVDLPNLKPVLEVDNIVIRANDVLMISKTTLEEVKKWNNPHWHWLENGSVVVKDKSVSIGKTIPIVTISVDKFSTIGRERDIANLNAGVKEVDYIYEGEETDGISNNLIKQINYTLKEEFNRPGDTFSIYDLQLSDDSVYSTNALVISKLQEDGKFDKDKLNSFLKEVSVRLEKLNEDFTMIKDTFYRGVPPISKGIKLFKNQIADTNSDTTFQGDSYTTETSTILAIDSTPKDKTIDATTKVLDATTKAIETKTTDLQKGLQQQREELATTQQRQTIQQQQIRDDLQNQISANDKYYREKYGSTK